MEVQPRPWGKSGTKWWIPNQDHGRSSLGASVLRGHDCAATLSQEMLTMFRMISDQDLAHPAWRWQCRRLHSATRQQRRVSCGTHTNIYVSGELRNSNQSLITIQRTRTTKIKTTSSPSWSEGIEVKNNICIVISFINIFFCLVETRCYNPFTRLVDLSSYRSTQVVEKYN